jgi:hypothetical protein
MDEVTSIRAVSGKCSGQPGTESVPAAFFYLFEFLLADFLPLPVLGRCQDCFHLWVRLIVDCSVAKTNRAFIAPNLIVRAWLFMTVNLLMIDGAPTTM